MVWRKEASRYILCKISHILQYSCSSKHFTSQNHLFCSFNKVKRLNTYTTVPASWSNEQLDEAKSVDIVTFASPSAVKTWSERAGTSSVAVVIGPTSQRAAEKAGFTKIFVPSGGSKGLEPWAQLIRDVANNLKRELQHTSSE